MNSRKYFSARLSRISEASCISNRNRPTKQSSNDSKILDHKTPRRPENVVLTFFKSQLFASVMEDVLIKMGILTRIKSDYQVTKVMSEMNTLMARKYHVEESNLESSLTLLQKVDPRKFHGMMYKISKLEDDRTFLIKAILDLCVELYTSQKFDSLATQVGDTIKEAEYRAQLMEEELKNKLHRRELYRQLRQLRNYNKTVIYDCNTSIEELKRERDDAEMTQAIQSRYIDNWQVASTEQNAQIINDAENVYIETSEHYKRRTENEARVHSDIDLLLTMQTNDVVQQVETWMHRYEEDLEAAELQIQIKKLDYQAAREKRMKIEEMLVQHENDMSAWISFKEEREKARIFREKMVNSALIVQAWWRGILVRKQLGPYRVKKTRKSAKTKKF